MFESVFSTLLFTVLKVICWAINRLTQLFGVFSGLTKVTYNGEDTFLFDVFLNNSTVNNIYWGMALIGLILCFGFAVFSVARKMFDMNNRNPMSTGQIITETVKSFFLIISMSLILTASITITDVLMRQINYMFTRSGSLDTPDVMEYTDEQYAAMGRALSTIANYGMNPSYNSRYNVNDCFNTIRQDLVYLEDQGVFDYNYQTSGVNSWQSALQEVANSADLRYELKSDVYYEKVVAAIEHVLEIMKNDASFRPLEKFERYHSGDLNDIPLDRIVFLVGTLDSANNNYFNQEPRFDDALRGPYYTGEKSLYDTDTTSSRDVISRDFDIGFSRFDYLVSYVLGIAVLYNTFVILLNLVARMFNILFLYIIAPPVLASRPLDGGAKTKQWMTAFLVQLLGVFGSIIVMRLLLIFIPVIFDPSLVLIQNNNMLNYFGKAIILIAAYTVAKKAASLLSGIISDTAGMQSVQAGDMSMAAQRAIGTGRRLVGGAVRTAGAAVTGAVGLAAAPLINKVKKPFEEYRRLGSEASSSEIARQAKERLAVESKMNELRGSGSGGGPKGGSSVQNDVSAQVRSGRQRSATQPQLKGPSLSDVQQKSKASGQQQKKEVPGPQQKKDASGQQQKKEVPGQQQKNNVSESQQQHEVPQEKSVDYGKSDIQAQGNDNGSQGLNDSMFSRSFSDYEPDDQQSGGNKNDQGLNDSMFSRSFSDYEPDIKPQGSGFDQQNKQFKEGSDTQQQSRGNTQPRRRNTAPQSKMNDFMRQTYRRYGSELNKNKDSE